MASLFRFPACLTACITRFRADQHGSVAVLVALAIFPVVLAAGIAIDFSRGRALQTKLQADIDMAALSAAQSYDRHVPNSSASVVAVANRLVDDAIARLKVQSPAKKVEWDEATKRVKIELEGAMGALTPFFFETNGITVGARAEVEVAKTPLNHFDIVVVIDATGSMGKLIADAKASAKNFQSALATALAARGYAVDKIRVRAIYFRDFNPPDMLPEPIYGTGFFEIPSQLASLQAFIDGGYAKGGWNWPEAGLEAFYTALVSPWSQPVEDEIEVFPIIAIWTDATADDPGDTANITQGGALYPAGMPRNYTDLRALWDNPAVIPQANKRAVLFGPKSDRGWVTVTTWPGWEWGGNIWDTTSDMATRLAEAIADSLPKKPPRLTQ